MSVRPCVSRLLLLSRRECGQSPPALGSSPRVQGKRQSPRSTVTRPRLIPACAGKTAPRQSPSPMNWAHPRVCGENLSQPIGLSKGAGSSPRVRGKPPARNRLLPAAGLIPACAGKTAATLPANCLERAHPRVCGENLIGLGADLASMGSSPRVRGKHTAVYLDCMTHRLIPACAGKTGDHRVSAVFAGAHPRVCGENPVVRSTTPVGVGSSPRVRGKRRFAERERDCRGAHPRVCGENREFLRLDPLRIGSSPRVRGKR